MEVHVQEKHHVDNDLHHHEGQDQQRCGGGAFEDIAHHQPERDHGKNHRQHKADHVFLQANVGAFRLVVIVVVCMLTHGSTPIR